jgi:hypothetical protein
MLYPRFAADSFWSFAESCKLMGVRRPAPPLGLITVAAMLPGSWTVRVDCNTASIADDDFAWADLVFTGGMLPQQADTRRLIEVCRSRGKCRRVGAVHSIKSRPRAANVRCPLFKSRPSPTRRRCPFCQWPTLPFHSITSSARASTDGGAGKVEGLCSLEVDD